jgi:hypothetical protein
MSDKVMVKDYPDIKQRYAVMMSVWKKAHKGKADIDESVAFQEYASSESYALAATSVGVNSSAVSHARELIKAGDFTESASWAAPGTSKENAFWDKHGESEYSKWFLGVDDTASKGTKGKYKFPIGNFSKIDVKGLKAAKSRAAQNGYSNIEKAADSLIKLAEGGKAEAWINIGEGTTVNIVNTENFNWAGLKNSNHRIDDNE